MRGREAQDWAVTVTIAEAAGRTTSTGEAAEAMEAAEAAAVAMVEEAVDIVAAAVEVEGEEGATATVTTVVAAGVGTEEGTAINGEAHISPTTKEGEEVGAAVVTEDIIQKTTEKALTEYFCSTSMARTTK